MKKYLVYGTCHMACVIEVEAASEREAIYEADQRPAADWELTTTNVQAPVRAESAGIRRSA